MTAGEKTSLARFLDLASDAIRDGYRSEEREYHFSDDPVLSAQIPNRTAFASNPAWDTKERIIAEIHDCAACGLCAARTNTVPGEGVERPLVMVVGEGPGAEEDAGGRPFVGAAGRLLDKMLAAIGLSRLENCFIANVVKCRPPNNRDPLPEEIAACAPFLERQIALLAPKTILCVGKIAAQTLCKSAEPIGKIRGRFSERFIAGRKLPLIATYHPSALLHDEKYKRPAWEDLKVLKARLEAL